MKCREPFDALRLRCPGLLLAKLLQRATPQSKEERSQKEERKRHEEKILQQTKTKYDL